MITYCITFALADRGQGYLRFTAIQSIKFYNLALAIKEAVNKYVCSKMGTVFKMMIILLKTSH